MLPLLLLLLDVDATVDIVYGFLKFEKKYFEVSLLLYSSPSSLTTHLLLYPIPTSTDPPNSS